MKLPPTPNSPFNRRISRQQSIPPRSKRFLTHFAAMASALLLGIAHATPVNIPNASFENPTTATGGNPIPVPGWVFNSPSGNLYGTSLIDNSFRSEGAASGNNYAFLINDSSNKTDTITSAASLGIITSNTSYTLTVAVGNVAGNDSGSNHSPGNVSFSLLADGIAFATDTVTNGTVPDGTFEDFSLTFQTSSSTPFIGEDLGIQLASLPTSSLGFGPAFDNVTLDATSIAAAPEPSSGALLVGGLLGLIWLMRRQNAARRMASAAACICLSATALHATSITIPNASFESPATPVSTTTNDTIIPGWLFTTDDKGFTFGTEGISKYFTSMAGSSGDNFAFVENFDTVTKETLTSATPLATIAPLTAYTLNVAVGNVKGGDTALFGAPGNVTLSLLANGVSVATEEVRNGTVANGTWEDFTLTYDSPAIGAVIGEVLTIQLASLPQTAWGYEAAFDNLTLDAVAEETSDPPMVPEPSACTLLLSGVLSLAWLTRRQPVLV